MKILGKQQIDELEGLIAEAQNTCSIFENLDALALESLDINLINGFIAIISTIEKIIYSSLIGSFLSSVNTTLSKTQYIEQVEPLIKKWSFIRELGKLIHQAEYLEFINELKELSNKRSIPLEGGASLMDIQRFIEDGFKKEAVEEKVRQVRNRVLNVLEKAKRAKEIMLSTNFTLMSPFDFENFVAKLFTAIGYKTELTNKIGGDYGVDVIAKKDEEIIVIQCKKYHESNYVGNREVQMLLGAMQLKGLKANKGILITTSNFTKQARLQAEDNPIELWDKEFLHATVKKYLIGN